MEQYNINTLDTHTNYAHLPTTATQSSNAPPAHHALMGSVTLHDKAARPKRSNRFPQFWECYTSTTKHSAIYCRCGESFTRQDTLKRHIAESSGTFPHACPVLGCGQSFKRPSHVKQHLRNVHGLDEATVSIMVPSGKGGARKGKRRPGTPSLTTTAPGVGQHTAVSSAVADGSMLSPVANQAAMPGMFAKQVFGVSPSDALNVGMGLDDFIPPGFGFQMEYGTAVPVPGNVDLMMNQASSDFGGNVDVGPAEFDFNNPGSPLFHNGYALAVGSSMGGSNTMPMSSAPYGLNSTMTDASFVDLAWLPVSFEGPHVPHVPQTGDGFGLNEATLYQPLVAPPAFMAGADVNHGMFTNPVLDPDAMLPATINSEHDTDFEAVLGDFDLENFSFEILCA